MALVGKILKGVMLADDRKALRFDTVDGGEIIVRVDGDCCSDSWVEGIELPALGFPCVVLEVNELDLADRDIIYEDGVTAMYGCQIKTTSGDMVIDYRNDSNGYYGGNLCWDDDDFYGGVFGQNVSTMNWQEVTEC